MAATPQYPSSSYPQAQAYTPPSYGGSAQPQYATQPYFPPSSAPIQPQYAPSSPILNSDHAATVYSSGYNPGYSSSAAPEAQSYDPSGYAAPPSSYAIPGISEPSYSPRAPSLPAYDYAPAPAASSQYSEWNASTGYSDFQPTRSTSYTPTPAPFYIPELTKSTSTSYTPTPAPSYSSELTKSASYGAAAYDGYNSSNVYAYDGGNSIPYGAKGTGASKWSSSNSYNPLGDLPKIAKALPKIETESKGGGIQRYHVKVLSDSSGLAQNVVCQIGLDGVRLLDPSNDRTLRIYPLETITKWEVNEPAVFTFWAKTAVDYEQRRTRLQSSSATTNAILDTLTAACVQLCEMVGSEPGKTVSASSNSNSEGQKKGTFDWFVRKPAVQEEKQHWVPDEAVTKCTACSSDFGPFLRRHHCRNCGDIFCDKCTRGRIALTSDEDAQPVRVCDRCLAEVTQRTTNAKESSRFASQHTHDDLAKKLQEELKRNAPKKTHSSADKSRGQTTVLNCGECGSISLVAAGNMHCATCGAEPSKTTRKSSRKASGKRMRDVACPTCTVHLEVEVPSSGSETVECGVCQHPFLVSA